MTDQSEMFDTLAQAKQQLRAGWKEGLPCPCCGRTVKLYQRSINGPMCRFLIWIVRTSTTRRQGEWIDRADGPLIQNVKSGGDYGKFQHWQMLEHKPNEDNPRLPRKSSGLWRPTPKGTSFAANLISVPKYAMIFDNHCYSYQGPMVTIADCLPKYFDFWETWGYE